ncbi:MAG: 6-pyruvoyl-tetrahydropterin synthase-related protein [bacterium]|nr:6-pyruvoyl-tetrahydropterin synthase-related protein [bacterium]
MQKTNDSPDTLEDAAEDSLSSHSGWPVIVLVILLGGLLIGFQYTTLDKFDVLTPAVNYILSQKMFDYISQTVPLDRTDAIQTGWILLICFILIGLEIWKGRLTDFFEQIFKSESRTRIALLLFSLLLVRFYFARGQLNWAGDGSSHICYAWIASQSFRLGEIPIWTNYLGTGSPFLQFYGFLFFYLVGLTDLFLNDVFSSIKLVMGTSHVLSGLGTYLFVRRLCNSRRAGFIAGLGFVLSMWHTQQVLIMGRLPLSVFYALLPWPFYYFEQLRFSSRRIPSVIGGGLTLGALAFTHPGYAFWATALLALYMLVRIKSGAFRKAQTYVIRYGAILWISGLIFGAYLTVPMWVERANVELEEVSHASYPDPTWKHVLLWSNYRILLYDDPDASHWYGGYIGITLVGLALVGLIGGLGKQLPRRIPLALGGGACLLASFVLVFGYRWPIVRSLSIVHALNAGRYLLFLVFFLSVMAGVGTWIVLRIFKHKTRKTFVLILVPILIDLGSTTFQHPFVPREAIPLELAPQFSDILRTETRRFSNGELPNFRLAFATNQTFTPLATAWLTYHTGIPSFLSGYREGLPAVSQFCVPAQHLIDTLFEDAKMPSQVRSKEEFAPTSKGLYLLNNRFICGPSENLKFGMGWKWSRFSPVVVAPGITGYPATKTETSDQTFRGLLDALHVNLNDKTAKRILILNYEGEEILSTSPRVEILEHRVWNQRVELRLKTSEPCFARLAYGFYPYLEITVNGQSVEPLQTVGRFIALKLDRGEHHIILNPRLSPLRRTLLGIDIALLIFATGIWIRTRPKGSS